MTGNILVLTQWGYEEGLIQSYTLPYLRIINSLVPEAKIYLVTEEKKNRTQQEQEVIEKELKDSDIYWLPINYRKLDFKKYIQSGLEFFGYVRFMKKNKISTIHTFCTPAGSYGYMLAKFTRARLIVDSYEPHSEYMRESGVWKEISFSYRVLSLLEKWQVQEAQHVIATTRGVIDFTRERFNIPLKNAYVKPACVDMQLFSFDPAARNRIREYYGLTDKIVCVFTGRFGGTYLDKEVFSFFSEALKYWKERFHVLLLSSASKNDILELCIASDFPYEKITHLSVSFFEVPQYLSATDFGITPVKPSPSKKFCTPLKDGEYWSVGLPVIITAGISDDSDIISKHKIGAVIPSVDKAGFQQAIQEIDLILLEPADVLRAKIKQVARQYRNFKVAEKVYSNIYQ